MTLAVVTASFTSLLILTGCSAPDTEISEVSPQCLSAFENASAKMNEHYDTHPMFGPEYDELYADGTISGSEQSVLDEMISDEEHKFVALVDPVYESCSGVEEFYAGAFANKDVADWALAGNEVMTREENKNIFVTSYCYGREDRPACSDFNIGDWE